MNYTFFCHYLCFFQCIIFTICFYSYVFCKSLGCFNLVFHIIFGVD